jgi:hypothetical protein
VRPQPQLPPPTDPREGRIPRRVKLRGKWLSRGKVNTIPIEWGDDQGNVQQRDAQEEEARSAYDDWVLGAGVGNLG